jgi:hypothetical protein
MAQRTIVDSAGRSWTCKSDDDAGAAQGQDIKLICSCADVVEPVHVSVGWQWEKMSENGLARIISQASATDARAADARR